MKKLTLRVSGARVGDAVRPKGIAVDANIAGVVRPATSNAVDASIADEASVTVAAPASPRFGLRARTPFVAPAPKAAVAIAAEDYATLEDYT